MKRFIYILTIFILLGNAVDAATRDAQLTNTTPYNYNYMYPYMNNKMRTNLNPGVTNSQSSNLIDTVVKTTQIPSAQRRVVARPTANRTNQSRAASNTTARRATQSTTPPPARSAMQTQNTNRRVVARSGMTSGAKMRSSNNNARVKNTQTYRANVNANTTNNANIERTPATRCLADYTECMDGYCKREQTAYNRCYCSSKLSQIDSQYQNSIDKLITEIITLQNTNHWTQAEMNEYWANTIGKYTGDNSWINLENALDIDWANTESRVRGQNAFLTGHDYCVQHLTGCYYMASNLRDAYRSQISRDCGVYERYLQNVQNAAESIVESYK